MFGILCSKHIHTRQGSNYCYFHCVGEVFELGITLLRELGLLEMRFSWLPVSYNCSVSKRK